MLSYLLALIDEETDKEFFVSLYEKYKKQMWFEANKVLKDSQMAEDAVHNAFISVAKNIKTVRAVEMKAIRAYLLRSAKNAAIDLIKKVSKEVSVENVYNPQDSAFNDEIISFAEKAFINQLLEELPPKYRDVIYYHFVLGISEKEISKILDIKVNTVRQQVLRGRRMFMENYSKEMEKIVK